MKTTRSVALGVGHYLPARVVENSFFESWLDTSDAWIRARTGIVSRRFAAEGETTADLGCHAARAALAQAACDATDVDAIIVATATPDSTFPATATRIQSMLGMTGGFAFDVAAVCAGFVFALSTADAMIRAGQARTVLVIGAETFSRLLDWQDRTTCVLLGAAEGDGTSEDRGILSTRLHSDGQHRDILYVDGGPSSTKTTGKLRMMGREVFKHAVNKLAAVAEEAMDHAGVTPEQIDWVVPHQANIRIIEATARKAHIPMERVVVTVEYHGNTSAASIPLALSAAVDDGRIARGQLVLMEAIGGGLAWGSALLRW